ncbi:MAG: alpha/beta hydrolase [Acidobacteriaceae bacterium]|nr:alpha/beta hydrolase [Acidobacteriaceae bacterium]
MRIRILQQARGRVPGDGVELAFGYWPGRGTPVVALHGITANQAGFIGVAERLAGRRPLFALDLRGRGDSDKPASGYGMEQHARDVAAAMRAMGLGPSLIIGHSMGGFVATALASQNPELVSALLLIDGGLAIKPSGNTPASEHVRAALTERINQLVRTYESRQAYLAFWKAQPTFPPEDWNQWIEAFLDYEVGGEGPVQPKALQAAVLADLMEGVNTDTILNRSRVLRVPVTFVRAETGFTNTQPPLYPDAIMDELRSYTPNLKDHKIDGTTHYTVLLGDRGASEIADLIANSLEAN